MAVGPGSGSNAYRKLQPYHPSCNYTQYRPKAMLVLASEKPYERYCDTVVLSFSNLPSLLIANPLLAHAGRIGSYKWVSLCC